MKNGDAFLIVAIYVATTMVGLAVLLAPSLKLDSGTAKPLLAQPVG